MQIEKITLNQSDVNFTVPLIHTEVDESRVDVIQVDIRPSARLLPAASAPLSL